MGYLGASSGTLCMGVGHAAEPSSYFFGLIDDVRIYDVALSAEKIEALTVDEIEVLAQQATSERNRPPRTFKGRQPAGVVGPLCPGIGH
jgi:hypothetical protein